MKKSKNKRYQMQTELQLVWYYGFAYNAVMWRDLCLCRIYYNRVVRYGDSIAEFDKWFRQNGKVKIKGKHYHKTVSMNDLILLELIGIIDSEGFRIKISNE